MEWVIILLMANAFGQIVGVGAFPITYASAELCDAAAPAAIVRVQLEVDKKQPGNKVIDYKCVAQTAHLDKMLNKVRHPPLKGQRDASRLHPIY